MFQTWRRAGPGRERLEPLRSVNKSKKMRISMIQKKERSSVEHKIGTVIGTILCILLVPVLIINITLIIRRLMYQGKRRKPTIQAS